MDEAIDATKKLYDSVLRMKEAWVAEQIPTEARNGRIRTDLLAERLEKWHVVKLGKVAKTIGGAGFPHDYQGQKTGRYPFYKVSDMNLIGNEQILHRAENYIDDTALKKLKARLIPAHAVVFPKVGAALLTNKRRLTSVECCIDNNMMAVTTGSVPHEYLLEFMGRIDFASMVQMGAVPSVNQSQIEHIDLPVLAPEKHQEFKKELERFNSTITTVEKQLATIQELLQKLTSSIFL